MTDYSKMSDQEINLAVHEAIIGYKLHPYGRKTYWYEGKEQQETTEVPDYCDSWAGAWPVISANKINLLWNRSNWSSWSSEFSELETNHENPLRAAMTVFLMMKDAENANPS